MCRLRRAGSKWQLTELSCKKHVMLSHLACEPKIEAVHVDLSMYWSTFANPIKWDHMAPRLTYHFEVAFIYEPWIPNKFTQKPCSQPNPLTSTLLAGQGKHPTGWASGKASGAPVAPRRGSEIGGFMGPFLEMLGSLGTEWIELINIMMWMIGMWSWWIVIFDVEMLSAMTCHHMLTCSGNLSYNSYSATREARWSVLLGTLVHLVPWRMTMSYHSGLIIQVEIKSIRPPIFWWLIPTQFRSYWGCGFLLSIIGLPGLPHYNTLHISHPGSGALHLHKGERLVDIGVETSWWYRGTNNGGIRLRLGYHEIVLQGDLCLMAQFILNPNTLFFPS